LYHFHFTTSRKIEVFCFSKPVYYFSVPVFSSTKLVFSSAKPVFSSAKPVCYFSVLVFSSAKPVCYFSVLVFSSAKLAFYSGLFNKLCQKGEKPYIYPIKTSLYEQERRI